MNIKVEIDIKGLDQLTESLALLGSALAYKNNMVGTAEAAVELIAEVKKEDPKEEVKEEAPNKEYFSFIRNMYIHKYKVFSFYHLIKLGHRNFFHGIILQFHWFYIFCI